MEPVAGYLLKAYGIWQENATFDRERFAACWDVAGAALPQPAVGQGRPGVGFLILHQTEPEDYLVLGWWNRENELPTRVFLRDARGWRLARGDESFCVWDLRVMWWEREAYVGQMLVGKSADATDAYLAAIVEGYA